MEIVTDKSRVIEYAEVPQYIWRSDGVTLEYILPAIYEENSRSFVVAFGETKLYREYSGFVVESIIADCKYDNEKRKLILANPIPYGQTFALVDVTVLPLAMKVQKNAFSMGELIYTPTESYKVLDIYFEPDHEVFNIGTTITGVYFYHLLKMSTLDKTSLAESWLLKEQNETANSNPPKG